MIYYQKSETYDEDTLNSIGSGVTNEYKECSPNDLPSGSRLNVLMKIGKFFTGKFVTYFELNSMQGI